MKPIRVDFYSPWKILDVQFFHSNWKIPPLLMHEERKFDRGETRRVSVSYMEALRFQLKSLPKLIYRGHEIVFRDTRGSWSRREEKKTERKIDERPVPLLLPVHDYITTTEECVFRIPSTARLAILHYYIPRRRSERSPWNLCVDIGYIGFWFVRFFKYRISVSSFSFQCVCVCSSMHGNEGFFRFGIVVERFFLL